MGEGAAYCFCCWLVLALALAPPLPPPYSQPLLCLLVAPTPPVPPKLAGVLALRSGRVAGASLGASPNSTERKETPRPAFQRDSDLSTRRPARILCPEPAPDVGSSRACSLPPPPEGVRAGTSDQENLAHKQPMTRKAPPPIIKTCPPKHHACMWRDFRARGSTWAGMGAQTLLSGRFAPQPPPKTLEHPECNSIPPCARTFPADQRG